MYSRLNTSVRVNLFYANQGNLLDRQQKTSHPFHSGGLHPTRLVTQYYFYDRF